MDEVKVLENMASCEKEKNFYMRVQNPLWLDPILDLVFSFLPKSALTNCRLVCRQWLEVSERHFIARNHESRNTVVLSHTRSLLSFLSTFVQRRKFDFELTGHLDSSPWSSFQINFSNICPLQRQLFLNTCGDSIRKICVTEKPDEEVLLPTLLRSCPNLRSLEFSCIIPQRQDFIHWFDTLKNSEGTFFPHLQLLSLHFLIAEEVLEETDWAENFFSALFQLMPKLQDLRVLPLNSDRNLPAFIQALKVKIEQNPKSSNFLGQLTGLYLPHLDTQDIHRLNQFHLCHSLHLETFWLVSFRSPLDWQTVLSFLQGQADTLKKLYLAPFTAALFFHFPLNFTLDRLSTLVFIYWGEILGQSYIFVPDILIHFPNLKKLIIRQPKQCMNNKSIYCYLDSSEKAELVEQHKRRKESLSQSLALSSMNSTRALCEKVSTISFCGLVQTEDLQNLDRLTKICPNVTDLELHFGYYGDPSTVRLVFERWQKLRRLAIFFYGWKQLFLVDSFFSGKYYHGSLSNLLEKNEKSQSQDKEAVTKIQSLLLLQDLRILEIHVGNGTDVSKSQCRSNPDWMFVSDEMVQTVLMKMLQLRELTIDQSSISPSCLETLSTTLNLEKCEVCDKVGKLIQFKAKDKGHICDKEPGGTHGSLWPQCRSIRRPPTHDCEYDGTLNQLFGVDSCCPIV